MLPTFWEVKVTGEGAWEQLWQAGAHWCTASLGPQCQGKDEDGRGTPQEVAFQEFSKHKRSRL